MYRRYLERIGGKARNGKQCFVESHNSRSNNIVAGAAFVSELRYR